MKTDKTLTFLTLILSALIIWASITGATVSGFYAHETENWRIQSVTQDTINLCVVVPLLLNTALMMSRGSQDARLLWAGTVAYVVYTYAIYCFSVHFNALFIVYCMIFGLGIFSLIRFVYTERNTFRYKLAGKRTGLVTGIYFMTIALFFALLWLSEILFALLNDTVPASLAEGGLFTNPVQVLDLSVCLPGLFIAGLLLIRREKPGFVLAPVLLTFLLLMNITVGVLTLQLNESENTPGIAFLMFSLAVFSLVLLALDLRNKSKIV